MSRLNIKTEFTGPECEYFRKNCNFTEEELEVFNMRVKGKTVVEISLKLCMGEATVYRKLKNIKRKIVKVL